MYKMSFARPLYFDQLTYGSTGYTGPTGPTGPKGI